MLRQSGESIPLGLQQKAPIPLLARFITRDRCTQGLLGQPATVGLRNPRRLGYADPNGTAPSAQSRPPPES
jgi:hypothetical protein